MRIAVVVPGLHVGTCRLQPWRYLWEIANELSIRGHEVDVLSEGATSLLPRGPSLTCIDVGATRGAHGGPLDYIRETRPDFAIWNVGATSTLSLRLPKLNATRLVAVFTSPLYGPTALARAATIIMRDPRSHSALLLGGLMPKRTIAGYLRTHFERVVFLGRSVANDLILAGLPLQLVTVAPPGRDMDVRPRPTGSGKDGDDVLFTYAGSPAPIRGSRILLRAFAQLGSALGNSRLQMLSRHERAGLAHETERLRELARSLRIEDRVEFVAGTIPRDRFLECLGRSDVVVLPFVLVPSEAPLGVLEAAGAGKPLISSALPAIADLAAPGSILVTPADTGALARAMGRLAGDRDLRTGLADSASSWYRSLPNWAEVAGLFERDVLSSPRPWP